MYRLIIFALLLSGCSKEEYFDNIPLVIAVREGRELLTHQDAPADWNYTPPLAEPIVDTPCVPQEYFDPAFVTGWWYIPEQLSGQMELCAYPHCVTVQAGSDVSQALDSLLNELNPAYSYTVYSPQPSIVVFIAKGTNDQNYFHGKVWLRPEQYHSGWGFQCTSQAFFFLGGLSFDEYMTAIDEYKSVDKFNFRQTNWDSTEYLKAFDKILECRSGREYADLRYLPYDFPDSIAQKFIEAGWDTVLH